MLTTAAGPSIVDRFGLGTAAVLTGPVDRGQLGRIWRLDTDRGRYAVKETFAGIHPDQAERAYAFAERAAAAGVCTPRGHRAVDGSVLTAIDGQGVRLYDWVELAAPDRGLDPEVVGTTLATLHQVGGPTDEPQEPFFDQPVGRDGWRELADRSRMAGAPFAGRLQDLIGPLLTAEELLTGVAPPSVLGHRDLWADNLRRNAAGTAAVIDWDNCGPVDPGQELAMLLVEFGSDQDRARRLVRSYRQSGGPGCITGPADFAMPVAVLGHLGALAVRHWLDSTGPAERARAADSVAEFVDEPLTLEVIDSLCGWVGTE